LEQFKTEIQEDNVSCWIPSVEGEKFKVHCSDDRGGWETMWCLYFDGSTKEAACKAFRGVNPGVPKVRSGFWVSENEIKPYLFSKLALTDDDSVAALTSPDLGTIRVSFWRVTYGETCEGIQTMADASASGPVHEKCKKGGSHIVAPGSTQVADIPQTGRLIKRQLIDPWDKPYGTFIFRYRPLELLQANGIAPRPSPQPDTNSDVIKVDDDENDSDVEEIRALKEKLSKARARRAGKRKLEGENENSKKVKAEQVEHSGHFQRGEVIDLTSD